MEAVKEARVLTCLYGIGTDTPEETICGAPTFEGGETGAYCRRHYDTVYPPPASCQFVTFVTCDGLKELCGRPCGPYRFCGKHAELGNSGEGHSVGRLTIKPPIVLTEKEHDLIRAASNEGVIAQAAVREAQAIAQGKQEKVMAIIQALGTRYEFPDKYRSLMVNDKHEIVFTYDVDVVQSPEGEQP